MVYRIDGVEVIAELVTEATLTVAKGFDPSAEVGDYALTLPDQTVGIVTAAVFEALAVSE